MLGLPAETPAAAVRVKPWDPHAWRPDEDDDEEVAARREKVEAHWERLRREMAEEERGGRGSL
jgi:hypothetical protein